VTQRETILVPVDFSEPSRIAARRALALAADRDAGVHLVHASTMVPLGFELEVSQSLSVELARAAKVRLDGFVEELDVGSTPLATSFQEDDPAHAIHDAAGSADVSMIVMGSNGRRGFDRWMLGSVASQAVLGAPKPVLIVRGEVEDASKAFQSIVFATDFTERSARVESLVAAWASGLGAQVEVVHVIRDGSSGLIETLVGAGDFEDERLEAAASRLAEVVHRLSEEGVHAKSKVLSGQPADEILRHAASTNADLVALATRGYTGLRRFLLGSVAQRVLSEASCSVLIDGEAAQRAEA